MRCVICHGDDIKKTEVSEEINFNGDIILLPIKILVCKNCGERYYDRVAMQKLEKAEAEIKSKKKKLKEIGKVLKAASI